MRKKWKSIALTVTLMALARPIQIGAAEGKSYETNTLYTIECSAYCDCEQLTATGTEVRDGICAFSPAMYGYVAVVYYDNELVGIYEIQDTGSYDAGVRTGDCLDIWMASEDACNEFGRKDCQIYFVKGEG